jgi:hypothetical protein
MIPLIALIISKGRAIRKLDEIEKLKKSGEGTAASA